MIAWRPELDQDSSHRQQHEQVVLLEHPRETADDDEGEQRHHHQADQQAEFLSGDGEDEVRVGVGQDLLDPTFARTAAQQAAALEGLEASHDLVAVAAGGVEEAVDAGLHVVEGEVGADTTGEEDQPDHRDQDQWQTGEEELHPPTPRRRP